jgi:hypothetical protein
MRLPLSMDSRLGASGRGGQARLALTIVAVLAAVSMAGCGRANGDRARVYPAEGQVVWNGKPLAGAQVVFYPQAESEAKASPPKAQTDSEGRFRLSTYAADDGAPEGAYAVTVLYYPPQKQDGGYVPGPNVLPKKYASPKTTDLRAQVVQGANSLPALVLQP